MFEGIKRILGPFEDGDCKKHKPKKDPGSGEWYCTKCGDWL